MTHPARQPATTRTSPIGARQRWTRCGRQIAEAGRIEDARDTHELRSRFEEALRSDPALADAATALGTSQAFSRFCGGARRAAGIDQRRRPDLWTHELAGLTLRVPPELRDRFDRVPGRRREDRLRALLEAWDERRRT